jgi:cytochrome c556
MKVNRIAGLVAGILLVPSALADGKTEAEYRQAVMKSIGGHMTAIVTIMKNQVHTGDLAMHGRGIATLSEVAPNVFPEGSDVAKSKSLPAVWEDRAGFDEAMNRFTGAAKDFAVAAESGDMSQIGPALKGLGGSCKGCHDDYKAE